jgi:hypothetical protein
MLTSCRRSDRDDIEVSSKIKTKVKSASNDVEEHSFITVQKYNEKVYWCIGVLDCF